MGTVARNGGRERKLGVIQFVGTRSESVRKLGFEISAGLDEDEDKEGLWRPVRALFPNSRGDRGP